MATSTAAAVHYNDEPCVQESAISPGNPQGSTDSPDAPLISQGPTVVYAAPPPSSGTIPMHTMASTYQPMAPTTTQQQITSGAGVREKPEN